jgi:RNA polymerase sigma-70 factor, ECF subfamily
MRPEKQKYSDFNAEVIPHLNLLKNYALKMTKDPDNSEDLLQDTLISAFRSFHNYEKGSNAKGWLLKIMKNAFINSYRKRMRQPLQTDYEDVLNFYENINSEDVMPGHYKPDVLVNGLDDEVVKALSILTDEVRTIVFLSDIEGYTYQEISDFVDCPVGTVRSRLHRTRKMLYALLYEYAKKNSYISSNNKGKTRATRDVHKSVQQAQL